MFAGYFNMQVLLYLYEKYEGHVTILVLLQFAKKCSIFLVKEEINYFFDSQLFYWKGLHDLQIT